MKGDKTKLRNKYIAIQRRYTFLDRKDDKGKSIYTYQHLLTRLANEYYLAEDTVAKILQINPEEWYQERQPAPTPPSLFD